VVIHYASQYYFLEERLATLQHDTSQALRDVARSDWTTDPSGGVGYSAILLQEQCCWYSIAHESMGHAAASTYDTATCTTHAIRKRGAASQGNSVANYPQVEAQCRSSTPQYLLLQRL